MGYRIKRKGISLKKDNCHLYMEGYISFHKYENESNFLILWCFSFTIFVATEQWQILAGTCTVCIKNCWWVLRNKTVFYPWKAILFSFAFPRNSCVRTKTDYCLMVIAVCRCKSLSDFNQQHSYPIH